MTKETIFLICLAVFDVIAVTIAVYLFVKVRRDRKNISAADMGLDEQMTMDVLDTGRIVKWCLSRGLHAGDTCMLISVAAKFEAKKLPAAVRPIRDRAFILSYKPKDSEDMQTCLIVCNTVSEDVTAMLAENGGVILMDLTA